MGTVIDPPSDLCRQLSLFGTSFYMLFPDLNARYFGVSIWAQNARFLVDVYILKLPSLQLLYPRYWYSESWRMTDVKLVVWGRLGGGWV